MIWATYLAHVSVEEGLADGVTMRVPIQTVGLAEGVELLRLCNRRLEKAHCAGQNTLTRVLVHALLENCLALAIIVYTQMNVEEPRDGLEREEVLRRGRAGQHPDTLGSETRYHRE